MNATTCTEAGPPFDKSTADVILRSSDNVDLRVHKAVLAIASPIFESLFSLPKGEKMESAYSEFKDDEVKDHLPVTHITKHNGETLKNLLRFCYRPPPKLTSVDMIIDLIDAADFYEMDELIPYLRRKLSKPKFSTAKPVEVYIAGWKRGWNDVVAVAAVESLQKELLTIIPQSNSPQLLGLPAVAILKLMEFHGKCSATASSCVWTSDHISWVPTAWSGRNSKGRLLEGDDYPLCGCENSTVKARSAGNKYFVKKWWIDYIDDLRKDLRKTPVAARIHEAENRLFASLQCVYCFRDATKGVRSANSELVKTLNRAIERVS